MSTRLLDGKKCFKKERLVQLAENLQSARCSPFVISKVLAARIRKLTTARARKNKRTACMLANARKDHSIPLNDKFVLQVPIIAVLFSENGRKAFLYLIMPKITAEKSLKDNCGLPTADRE